MTIITKGMGAIIKNRAKAKAAKKTKIKNWSIFWIRYCCEWI